MTENIQNNETYSKNIFTSKANVLKFLQKNLKKSHIEQILDFSVHEWKNNNDVVLDSIIQTFSPKKIIVRSSVLGEDSVESSKAGVYESILNVSSESKSEITEAVNSVIDSYSKVTILNDNNLVLIQKQTIDIDTSGVLFTKTNDNGSPYYVINFDSGRSTDVVTSGKVNNSIKIFRKTDIKKLDKKWTLLLQSVKEIESLLKNHSLDIEFGITQSNDIIIFQVRPITSINSILSDSLESETDSSIKEMKNQFHSLIKNDHLPGKNSIFSDMADWNPAEIIGNSPNPLDYSLYDYLIMNSIWEEGRRNIGYYDIHPCNLMTKFGNKPFVDIRASFNSLIPSNINSSIRSKLINFYLKKLQDHPYLHDKVEFEILFTCYDFNIDVRLKELLENDFSSDETNEIKKSLHAFTKNILKIFPTISTNSYDYIEELNNKRRNILTNLNSTPRNFSDLLNAAKDLLFDCIELGTKPFSTMARIAFIAVILLKSANSQNGITSDYIDSLMRSIRTPLSKLRDDFDNYCNNKMDKKQFLEKYGHLRPGTYDITATRYDKEKQLFENIKFVKPQSKKSTSIDDKLIDELFLHHSFNLESFSFSEFLKTAVSLREELKFHFTRNLSDTLELIAEAGEKFGFTREEMAYLSISDIMIFQNISKDDIIKSWNSIIQNRKERKKITDSIQLPPIIFSSEDFEIIRLFEAKPNFITPQSITADLIDLQNSPDSDITNKIVLIENADPGFDWIFTKSPAGLITKYGGTASHMSIRCSELGLPAAIGCGEILFDKILSSRKILLDCKNEKIIVLEQSNYDEDNEVEKTLKSIGYIK